MIRPQVLIYTKGHRIGSLRYVGIEKEIVNQPVQVPGSWRNIGMHIQEGKHLLRHGAVERNLIVGKGDAASHETGGA